MKKRYVTKKVLNSPIPKKGRNITSYEAEALRKIGVTCSSKGGIWQVKRSKNKGITGYLYKKGVCKYIKVKLKFKYIKQFFPKTRRTGILRVYKKINHKKENINVASFLLTPGLQSQTYASQGVW